MKLFSPCFIFLACLLAGPATHAAPSLGLQAWTFRELTFAQTLEQARTLGITNLQAYPGQELGGGLNGRFVHTMDAATLRQVLALAKASRVSIVSYGVVTPGDEAEWTQLLTFARNAGIKELVTEARPEMLSHIAPLAKKHKVRLSLHNHPVPSFYGTPEAALTALAGLGDHVGLCADTGHWARSGLDPVDSLKLAHGRIHSLHFKDIAERGKNSRDLPWGTGTSNVAGQLAELRRQKFNGVIYIEYEHQSPALFDDVSRCVTFFSTAARLPTDELTRGLIAPAGFSRDVRPAWADSRGKDSVRWPAPQPLFAADLSNAVLAYPGAWTMSAEGILTPNLKPGTKPGDIWTKETYGDFVVSMEFRAQAKSNSGVFLRSTDIVHWLQNSIEIQILQHEADKPVHLIGAVYDVAAPAVPVSITPGQWYRYVITARGSKLSVTLNGEEINKVDLDQWTQPGVNTDGTPNKFTKAYKDMARSGRIGLQYHNSPIEFRNLLVERL